MSMNEIKKVLTSTLNNTTIKVNPLSFETLIDLEYVPIFLESGYASDVYSDMLHQQYIVCGSRYIYNYNEYNQYIEDIIKAVQSHYNVSVNAALLELYTENSGSVTSCIDSNGNDIIFTISLGYTRNLIFSDTEGNNFNISMSNGDMIYYSNEFNTNSTRQVLHSRHNTVYLILLACSDA